MSTQYFDDGSTMTTYADGSVTATPWQSADMIQNSSGSSTTDYFGALRDFGGIVTNVGGTIASLYAQKDAFANMQSARELQAARQASAVFLGKNQLDIAAVNATRDLALAKANAANLSGALNPTTLLMLAALAGVAIMVSHK